VKALREAAWGAWEAVGAAVEWAAGVADLLVLGKGRP
jgi:hypothetical protein